MAQLSPPLCPPSTGSASTVADLAQLACWPTIGCRDARHLSGLCWPTPRTAERRRVSSGDGGSRSEQKMSCEWAGRVSVLLGRGLEGDDGVKITRSPRPRRRFLSPSSYSLRILCSRPGDEAMRVPILFPQRPRRPWRPAGHMPGSRKSTTWTLLVLALAQLPGRALAGVSFTNNDYYVKAGQPFTITWTDNVGPVTITLMDGPDINLHPVLVIASAYDGRSFTWTPPPTLATGAYELQIQDSGSTDYSSRFTYTANVSITPIQQPCPLRAPKAHPSLNIRIRI